MRILIITPHFPWIGCGGGLRLFNTIKSFSEGHKVTLLTILKPDQEHLVKELSQYCEDIITVRREGLDTHEQGSVFGKFFKKLLNFYRLCADSIKEKGLSLPSDVLRYNRFHLFRKKVNELVKSKKFDLVEVNFTEIGFLGREIPDDVIKIYSSHEVRTVNRFRSYKMEKNILKRFKYYVEWRRTEHYENILPRMYDVVIAYSPKDKEFFTRNESHNAHIIMIPTGVDLEQHVYEECAERDQTSLVFLGYYNNRPNEYAVIYFAEEILPVIKEKIPNVRFYVVGSNPTQRIIALADDQNIFVTGFVDDLRTYLHKCTVFVVPIRLGGGIKGKIIEAMAYGIPVVSTPEGCEGIEFTPGENIIVSNSTKDFIRKTLHLLEDKKLQQRISFAGRELVEEKYNWVQNFKKLEKSYESVLKNNAKLM